MYSVREFGNTCLLYSLDDVLRYGDLLNIPRLMNGIELLSGKKYRCSTRKHTVRL
jgi:hypothetical protein